MFKILFFKKNLGIVSAVVLTCMVGGWNVQAGTDGKVDIETLPSPTVKRKVVAEQTNDENDSATKKAKTNGESDKKEEAATVKDLLQLGLKYIAEEKYSDALNCFQQAGEDPIAQHNVGAMYLLGHGVPISSEEALKHFKYAAKKNFPPSQYNIALIYEWKNDQFTSLVWLTSAALNGHVKAQCDLGVWECKNKNYLKSMDWFETAAANGSVVAQYNAWKIRSFLGCDN